MITAITTTIAAVGIMAIVWRLRKMEGKMAEMCDSVRYLVATYTLPTSSFDTLMQVDSGILQESVDIWQKIMEIIGEADALAIPTITDMMHLTYKHEIPISPAWEEWAGQLYSMDADTSWMLHVKQMAGY